MGIEARPLWGERHGAWFATFGPQPRISICLRLSLLLTILILKSEYPN